MIRGARQPATPEVCQRLALPAYFLPGPLWDLAIASSPNVRYLVANPSNGPGVAPHANYARTLAQARDSGIRVLGYVDTGYGRRDPDLVARDVERHQLWYGVAGIFLDQVSGAGSELDYYLRIVDQVRTAQASLVALNPGIYPIEHYARLGDLLVTFEGDYDSYGQLRIPPWASDYPADLFWHLVYGTPKVDASSVLDFARSRGAANVYVTDGRLPNPWDRLPTYWAAAVEAIGSAKSTESGQAQQPTR